MPLNLRDRNQLYSCLLGNCSSPSLDAGGSHSAEMIMTPANTEFSPVSAKYFVNNILDKYKYYVQLHENNSIQMSHKQNFSYV